MRWAVQDGSDARSLSRRLWDLSALGSRVLIAAVEDWEAGENPALPRNCMRGNLPSATGISREGRWSDVELLDW